MFRGWTQKKLFSFDVKCVMLSLSCLVYLFLMSCNNVLGQSTGTTPRPLLRGKYDGAGSRPTSMAPENSLSLLDLVDDRQTLISVDLVDILSLEIQTCGAVCEDSKPGYPQGDRVSRLSKCLPCYCDTLCSVNGDCCPDVVLKHKVTYTEQRLASCLPLVPVPVEPMNSSNSQLPIQHGLLMTHCGDQSVSDDIRDKCLNPDLQNVSQAIPVTSRSTGLAYRNVFCAICNGEEADRVVMWSFAVQCEDSNSILLEHAPTAEAIFLYLSSREGVTLTGCQMTYVPGKGQVRPCIPKNDLVSTCNQTGDATFIHPRVAEACELYLSPFNRKYRNIFCFLCNANFISVYGVLEQKYQGHTARSLARLDFSALIDLASHTQSANTLVDISTDCSRGHFFDRTSCSCRPMQCAPDQFLSTQGHCQTLVLSPVLGYKICLTMRLGFSENITQTRVDRVLDSLRKAIEREFWHKARGQFYLHGGRLLAKRPTLRSLDILVQADFIVSRGSDNFKRMGIHEIKHFIVTTTSWIALCDRFSAEFSPICPVCSLEPQISCSNHSFREIKVPIHTHHRNMSDHFIPYIKTKCPFVVLPENEPHRSDYTFPKAGSWEKVNVSHVRMCVSTYTSLWPAESYKCQELVFMDMWTPTGLISIVCTCLSLLCLALTLLTYAVLAPLRAGGGKTVMCMAAALFTAQALYEFALEQVENSAVCRALGVLTHYAWLVTIFFMNACTLERFLKLCFPLRSHSLFLSKTPLIAFTTYSMLGPALIVAVNIGVHYATGGGFAYGNSYVCFINTSLGRVLAWAVPLGLLVLTNTALMVITVCKLRRQARLGVEDLAAGHRVSLLATWRLSIFTGCVWLLAFFYDGIDHPAGHYVITALIGLQGVVLFFCTVVNSRVKHAVLEVWQNRKAKSETAKTRLSNTSAGTKCM